MAKRLKTDPRKLPRQERAIDTVDTLLATTERLLITDGYDRLSTNRVADKAGISIGSLYQYFPNKEAIVAALIERHLRTMQAICREALERHEHDSLAVTARETVKAMVAAHAVNPRLQKVLREQVPRVGKLVQMNEQHHETARMVGALLATRQEELRVKNIDLAAFIAVEAVAAVLHAAFDRKFGQWSEERLVDELTDLLLSYLRG